MFRGFARSAELVRPKRISTFYGRTLLICIINSYVHFLAV